MKKIFFLIVISILSFSRISLAQMESGVYKTADDFRNGKLSLGANCDNQKHKIKLNDFFNKDYITVIHEGKEVRFKKNSVYASKLCDGSIYRFFGGNDQYEIINPEEQIIIYKKAKLISGKGTRTPLVNYYFSKDASSSIEELTIMNLKNAFPDNHAFHDAIDATFKSNADLASYDNFHKMYKVNWLLKQNKNKTTRATH